MNKAQRLWWEQAASDFGVYCLLRKQGAAACHQLHYLQMACEKIAKAYLWRNEKPPPTKHLGFVDFLKAISGRSGSDKERIAKALGFSTRAAFEAWSRPVSALTHEIRNLAPAIAGDGPNAEYPWPHTEPVDTPVNYEFLTWRKLTGTAPGRLRHDE